MNRRRAAGRVTTAHSPSRHGMVRPLAQGRHAKAVPHLAEVDCGLRALGEPADDRQRVLRRIDAGQGLPAAC